VTQHKNIVMLKRGVAVEVSSMRTREECSFLSWFFADGKYLRSYVHGSTLDEVAALYSQWFESYEKIYRLFYEGRKRSWFFSTNSKPKKLSEMEAARLEAYVDDLTNVQQPLLRKLEILQRRVEHNTMLSDEKYSDFVKEKNGHKAVLDVLAV